MSTFTDLHGVPLAEGTKAKLSGGYADSAVPTYLIHEAVTVVGFGRSRVIVRLDSRDYASRPPLRVLPKTLVVTPPAKPDVNKIMAFEAGELDNDEVLELFGGLIASGIVWQLQGSYGRTATSLIEAGLITPEGEVVGGAPTTTTTTERKS